MNPTSSQPNSSFQLPPQPLASLAPKWYQSRKKLTAVIGGLVAALVLLAVGGYAWWQRSGGGGITVQNVFQQMPEPEATPRPTISGLSGMPCAHPDRRPVGVMLAGDPINRPVSGFAKADMVWELPVLVSNVTRLLAVYQCGEPKDIGSVRSARHDYLFLAEGVDAVVAHWGGSYHALNRIAAGEFQTLNALTNPHNAFFRKNNLPAPYNGFTTYERLWNALTNLKYRDTTQFAGYDFKDDIAQGERATGGRLTVSWPGQFAVRYEYDPATNRYARFWAGTRQVDGEDGAPVAPSSVVIMRAENRLADGPGGYNDVAIEGSGPAEIYQDGKVIKGTWRKNELEKKDPVHFMNEAGDPIIFTRGQLWVMAVAPAIAVTWEGASAIP